MPSAPAPRSELIDVGRGPRLHVLHWGEDHTDPTPLVLIHGLASNARLWDGVAATLAANGHRAVAVDLRGHGRSDKPDHGYEMASVADDVAALLETLGFTAPGVRAVVSGQSWGANVVIELAVRHPDAAAAVVCVDGGTITLSERFDTFDACWEVLAPPRFPPELTREQLVARMRKGNAHWPDSGVNGALACFEDLADGTVRPWLTRDRHQAVLAGLFAHRPHDRLAEIKVPVLFIPADTGEVAWSRDKRAAVDAALEVLADGRVRWFSPADHDVHAQYPEEVAALLQGLAQEVRPAVNATHKLGTNPDGRS
ncbi:MAG: alpha/beta fold hydrolase [Acidimicrobiales bacterium]